MAVAGPAPQVMIRPYGARALAVGIGIAVLYLVPSSTVIGLYAWSEQPLVIWSAWLAVTVALNVGLIWMWVRCWNLCAVVDAEQVVLRNAVRTHRLHASEVIALDLDQRSKFAVLRLRDGTTARVGAIKWSFSNYDLDPASPRSVEARLAVLADALGVPEPVMPDWAGKSARWRAMPQPTAAHSEARPRTTANSR